ncbi:MAG: PaaI family thioesterase [Bacillota bacterium]|nr:PaaI family thioesterase [Bacillota bacterium]
MRQKVTSRQYSTNNCFVCGENNNYGVGAKFYEIESEEVVCIFNASSEHAGYPGRLHGGIASAILDETIGRAILIKEPGTFAVTLELNTQYKKPVPVNQELKAIGRLTSINGRIFEGTGEILLENGEVAVIAHAKYLKMPIEKIANDSIDADRVLYRELDIDEIDL